MRVAVLVSGSGSNLQALIDTMDADPHFGAEIVAVIADREGIRALDRAAAAGLPSEVVTWPGAARRDEFTAAICDTAERHDAGALVLAGFMRILSREAIARFPDRIVNVHPALLPAFPGAHAVRDALAHGVKVTGVTVHFVDAEVDNGPIISQQAVSIRPDDDEASLSDRLHAVEHELLPGAVKALAHGRLAVDGRRVTWTPE